MKAKDFLEEIDYYNTNVEGQLYEELGIETLADMMELYHERKLKLLGIAVVSQQRELLIAYSKYLEKQECRGFDCYIDDFIELNSN